MTLCDWLCFSARNGTLLTPHSSFISRHHRSPWPVQIRLISRILVPVTGVALHPYPSLCGIWIISTNDAARARDVACCTPIRCGPVRCVRAALPTRTAARLSLDHTCSQLSPALHPSTRIRAYQLAGCVRGCVSRDGAAASAFLSFELRVRKGVRQICDSLGRRTSGVGGWNSSEALYASSLITTTERVERRAGEERSPSKIRPTAARRPTAGRFGGAAVTAHFHKRLSLSLSWQLRKCSCAVHYLLRQLNPARPESPHPHYVDLPKLDHPSCRSPDFACPDSRPNRDATQRLPIVCLPACAPDSPHIHTHPNQAQFQRPLILSKTPAWHSR